MKLIPFTKYYIDVESDEASIKDRLNQHVENFWKNGKAWKKSTIFTGELTEEGFVIRRNIKYQNSFLPVLIGSFEKHGSKTRVRITARMFILTNIFMVVWLACALFGMLVTVFTKEATVFIPLLMFTFGWALMSGGFWFEFPRTIKELKRVIEQNANKSKQQGPSAGTH